MKDIVSRFLREDVSEKSPLQGGETVCRWDSVYRVVMVREGSLAGQVDAVATEPSHAPTKSSQQLTMIKADLEALYYNALRALASLERIREADRRSTREVEKYSLARQCVRRWKRLDCRRSPPLWRVEDGRW
jgi:hypothetical protein